MLSKKMAVSLTSLITILALAFVAPTAMAAEFSVSLSLFPGWDVSSEGGNQVTRQQVPISVKFGKVVALGATTGFDATDIEIIGYNEDGGLRTVPQVTDVWVGSPNDGTNYGFYVPMPPVGTAKSVVYIAKHKVQVADPVARAAAAIAKSDDDKSAEATFTLDYVRGDQGLPRVVSIERVGNPLLKLTKADTTVQAIITLSEKPDAFGKDQVDVTNATWGDPVALDPVAEDPLGYGNLASAIETAVGPNVIGPAPVQRGLYNEDRDMDDTIHGTLDTTPDPSVFTEDEGDLPAGIHGWLNANPDGVMAEITAYNAAATAAGAPATALTQAAGVAGGADPTRYFPEVLSEVYLDSNDDGTPDDPNMVVHTIPIHRPFTTYELVITAPTDGSSGVVYRSANWAADATVAQIEAAIVAADAAGPAAATHVVVDRTQPGVVPTLSEFRNRQDYTEALALYNTQVAQYELYMAEQALYEAYLYAVEAQQEEDTLVIEDYISVQLGEDLVPRGTGRDDMLYPYVLTITPKFPVGKADIVVTVKEFEDQSGNKYTPPVVLTEGIGKLTIKVDYEELKPGTAGIPVTLNKEHFIPKDGYLVVVDDADGSAVINPPGGAKDAPPVTRSPAGQKYNVHSAKALPNLEGFLLNGGTIDVVSPLDLRITEVMWGTDASLTDDNSKSQWIELINLGAGANTLDDDANTAADEATTLMFYGPGETLPAVSTVKDRIGGLTPADLVGRGQSGRTGVGEEKADLTAVVPTLPLISMRRLMVAGKYADGTLAASWVASGTAATGLGINFKPDVVGRRIGSPGSAHVPSAAETAAEQALADAKAKADADAAAKAADKSVVMPTVGKIYISEIMFAGGGTLPQWIEISNGSRTEEVNLSGWTLKVDNAVADAAVEASITFTIPDGTKIAPSERHDPTGDNMPSTILVVTEAGRTNLSGAKASGQVLNLWVENQTELILAGISKRRYKLLSDQAFQITLAPPAPTATASKLAATATAAEKAAAKGVDAQNMIAHEKATDTVGNLGPDGAAAWALPMSEDGRSSIVRRHVPVAAGPASPETGTDMKYWILASDTSFGHPQHFKVSSYYGAMSDQGTPGFRVGSALPVELSHFRPARDKATGQVMITWSTQSELNNAGFFVKRSQQRDGEFKVINATMIPGAGTTSEKQFYTYTDTTAQPNVVYYYQIEDVSLDGNRQTLTRGIRLKGHVGAAGKATTLWGELKTSHE